MWLIEELSLYPPDCMVLFVDVDVVFQDGWEVILDKYVNVLKSPKIVMGAECESNPSRPLSETLLGAREGASVRHRRNEH